MREWSPCVQGGRWFLEDVMLNTKALRNEAKVAFISQLSQKVIYIATQCWASSIDSRLKDVNSIILAARKFDLTKVEIFTDAEITEITQDLKDLHALGMKKRMNEHLISVLRNRGMADEVLEKCVASEEDLKRS